MTSFHITFKLMEIEKRKVEIDEIDVGYCLIHVLYMVLPCGYTNLMGAYKIERKHSGMNKMTFFRGQTSISFSKFIHLV